MRLDDMFEKCDCDCHKWPKGAVQHITPCCLRCRRCGANIRFGQMDEHLQKCQDTICDDGYDWQEVIEFIRKEGGPA